MVTGYWLAVHPPSWGLIGSGGDSCSDIVRQLMSEQLDKFGRPVFVTDSVMAPTGASVPYMSWSIERDWIGAYFWKASPEFPYLWFSFGVSLVLSFFFVAWVAGRMGLGVWSRWLFAAAVVVFHVPRQFKAHHHFEHVNQHWI